MLTGLTWAAVTTAYHKTMPALCAVLSSMKYAVANNPNKRMHARQQQAVAFGRPAANKQKQAASRIDSTADALLQGGLPGVVACATQQEISSASGSCIACYSLSSTCTILSPLHSQSRG
eukprot:GHRQ01026413.1.p1 GENE.GHRQ01026413.1~~GHRQ01026413.1.p1  ORF type:complete len:119 (-),score=27.81 GHRQ01026413.1:655-1011(-)